MAIITKPVGGVLKGVPATFTLSKVELLAVPMVAADSYFSDSDNWNKVILKYKSSEGKQYEVVEFNATLSSPTGTFSVSEKARDEFEIQTLEIIDFDGGIFIVPRGALTVAEFDIDFGAGVPQPVPVMWLANPAYVLEGDGGATASATRPSYGEYSLTFADPSQYVTGDFTFEAVLSSTYNLGQNFIGFYDSTSPTITTAFTGASIYFEQAIVASYSIPTSPTYTVKIQRIGLNVKFYVNDVEKYSGTHTDINKAKVPFFTFTDNAKYSVRALTLPESVATYVDWTESANYNTAQLDGGLTSNIANYNDTNVSSMNYATQDVSQGTGKILTYKIKGSDLWLGGYAFIGFGLSNTFWGFYKNSPTAGNSLSLLYGNSVIGTYTGIIDNSTIVTLEIKTKSTGFEFWVDGVKVGESTAITSGTLKPTARIYQGMEITEAYFE
jgi:hypothetical protein